MEFKIGDRVRRIKKSPSDLHVAAIPVNSVAIISKIQDNDFQLIGGGSLWFNKKFFKKVNIEYCLIKDEKI